MRETRYIIVIYGMDYGLHHKRVFLVLDEWEIWHSDFPKNTQSRERCIISITCSLSLPYPILIHEHRNSFICIYDSKYIHFFPFCLCNSLQQDSTEISCDALLHKDSKREKAVRWGGEVKGRKMADRQGWYGTCSAKRDGTFLSITSLLVKPQLKHIKGVHCQHGCFVMFTIW